MSASECASEVGKRAVRAKACLSSYTLPWVSTGYALQRHGDLTQESCVATVGVSHSGRPTPLAPASFPIVLSRPPIFCLFCFRKRLDTSSTSKHPYPSNPERVLAAQVLFVPDTAPDAEAPFSLTLALRVAEIAARFELVALVTEETQHRTACGRGPLEGVMEDPGVLVVRETQRGDFEEEGFRRHAEGQSGRRVEVVCDHPDQLQRETLERGHCFRPGHFEPANWNISWLRLHLTKLSAAETVYL